MKFVTALLLGLVFSFNLKAQDQELIKNFGICRDAYNNAVEVFNQKTASFNIYITTNHDVAEARISNCSQKVSDINEHLKLSIIKFKSLPQFDNSYALRDSTISCFQKILVLNQSADMLAVINYDDRKSVDDMIAYQKAQFKLKKYTNKSIKQFEAYLTSLERKHNFKINPDSRSLDTRKKNEAVRYVNKIAPYSNIMTKYYNDILGALNVNNDSLAKRRTIEMKKYAIKVLVVIKNAPGYNGNRDLIQNCIDKAKFLSGDGFNYLVNMIKANSYMQSKSSDDLSEDEVDKYNKAIDSYNNASSELEKKYTEITNKHNKYLAEFINKNYR